MTNVWIFLCVILLSVCYQRLQVRASHESFLIPSSASPAATPTPLAPSAAPMRAQQWHHVCQRASDTGFRNAFMTTTQDMPESCRPVLEEWLATRDVEASRELLTKTCLSPLRRIQFLALIVLEHLREWMEFQQMGVDRFCKKLDATIATLPNADARAYLRHFQASCQSLPAATGPGATEACTISFRRWAYDGVPLPEGCSQNALISQIDALFRMADNLDGEATAIFCTAVSKLVSEFQSPGARALFLDRAPCKLSEREDAFKAWSDAFQAAITNFEIDGKPAWKVWKKAYETRRVWDECTQAALAVQGVLPTSTWFADRAAVPGSGANAYRTASVLDRTEGSDILVRIHAGENRALAWSVTPDGSIVLRREGQHPSQFWMWESGPPFPEGIRGLRSAAKGALLGLSQDGALEWIPHAERGRRAPSADLVADTPTRTIFFRTPPMLSFSVQVNALQQIQDGSPLVLDKKGSPWELQTTAVTRDVLMLLGDQTQTSAQSGGWVIAPSDSMFGVAMQRCAVTGWVFLDQDPDDMVFAIGKDIPLWELTTPAPVGRIPVVPLAMVVRPTARTYQVGVRVRTLAGEEKVVYSKMEVLARQWVHLGVSVDRSQVAFFFQGDAFDKVDLGKDTEVHLNSYVRLAWRIWPTTLLQGSARGWLARNDVARPLEVRKDANRHSPILLNQLTPTDIVVRRQDGEILLPMGVQSQPLNAVLYNPYGWSWPTGAPVPKDPVYVEYRWPHVLLLRRIMIQGAGLSFPRRVRVYYLDNALGTFVPGHDLTGTTHAEEVQHHELAEPLVTGAVRLHIMEWHGRPALRAGFHGEVLSPPMRTNLDSLKVERIDLRAVVAEMHSGMSLAPAATLRVAETVTLDARGASAAVSSAPPAASDAILASYPVLETAMVTGSANLAPTKPQDSSATVLDVCRHLMTIRPDMYPSLRECIPDIYERMAKFSS